MARVAVPRGTIAGFIGAGELSQRNFEFTFPVADRIGMLVQSGAELTV